ncbi:MAG: pyridoxamine 5'-phosphate oxidase [Chitinophagales bacterium]
MKKIDALQNMRENYKKGEFDISSVSSSPFVQFAAWFQDAQEADVSEPNAMVLSTVSAEAKPSSRVVLLKDFDVKGFVFFTNYLSKKGKDLAHNNFACLNFWWGILERQVRIEGSIEKISAEESDAYFSSRPVGSQAGAIVSPQSEVIESREWLEKKYLEMDLNETKKRPAHWGGYILIPDMFEFWQGRENRLHDRLQFIKSKEESWKIKRLAP